MDLKGYTQTSLKSLTGSRWKRSGVKPKAPFPLSEMLSRTAVRGHKGETKAHQLVDTRAAAASLAGHL